MSLSKKIIPPEKISVTTMSAKEKIEYWKTKKKTLLAEDVEKQTLREVIQKNPEELISTKPELEKQLKELLQGLPQKKVFRDNNSSSVQNKNTHEGSKNKLVATKPTTSPPLKSSKMPFSNSTSKPIPNIEPVSINPVGVSAAVIPIIVETPRLPTTSETFASKLASQDVYLNTPSRNRASTLFVGNRGSARISNLIDASTGKFNPQLSAGLTSAKLVDYIFLVGPSIQDLETVFDEHLEAGGDISSMAAIVYPQMLYLERDLIHEDIDINTLPFFCFPSGIDVVGEYDPIREGEDMHNSPVNKRFTKYKSENPSEILAMRRSQTYVFRLQGHTSIHYAVCLTIPRQFLDNKTGVLLTTNYCLCLVTEYPYFSFLSYMLQSFDEAGGLDFDSPLDDQGGLLLRQDLKCFGALITRLKRQMVPSMGQQIDISFVIRDRSLQFNMLRLHGSGNGSDRVAERDLEVCYHTMLWALPTLLRCFPLDQIVLVLGLALTEMKLIVLSPYLKETSACILALLSLLRPLKWSGSVIVTCPDEFMLDFLDNPVPFLLGAQRLPQYFVHSRDIAILDCSKKTVILHDDEVVTSNTLAMPQSSKLSKHLKPSYDEIKSIVKKTVKEHVGGWEVYKSGQQGLAMPPELNLQQEAGQNLRSAVSFFYTLINKHIAKIVDTAVMRDPDPKTTLINRRKRGMSVVLENAPSPDILTTLPSLQVDNGALVKGPIFSEIELGAHGVVFIHRVLDTQMYGDYSENLILQFAEAKAAVSGVGPVKDGLITPRSGSEKSDGGIGKFLARIETNNEPWTQVFGIMLSGTRPTVYASSAYLRNYYEGDVLPPNLSNTGLLLCNGNCDGKANTPECTSLCVKLWVEKVRVLRHQVYLKQLIDRQYPKQIVLHDVLLPDGRTVQVKPRLNPVKHTRETNSQYLLRKSEVLMFDGTQKRNEKRAVDTSRAYAHAIVKLHNKKMRIGAHQIMLNQQRAEARRLRWSSAAIIQAYARRYLVRSRIIPMLIELIALRRKRLAIKFSQLLHKNVLAELRVGKKRCDLQRFSQGGSITAAKSRSTSDLPTSYNKDGPISSARSLAPLTANSLRTSRLSESERSVGPKREDDAASVGSATSSRFGRMRGSIKLATIKEFLGIVPKRGKFHSVDNADSDAEGSQQQEEGEVQQTPTPPKRRSSMEIIMGSPKVLWKAVRQNLSTVKETSRISEGDETIMSSPAAAAVAQSEMVSKAPFSSYSPPRSLSADNEPISMTPDSPTGTLIPLPLRSMPRSVFKILIAQQRQLLVDMWKMLRQGVQILKHSKTSRPKIRYLYCDVDMKKFFWRSTDKDKPNDKATNEEDSEGEREREVERRKSVKEADRRKSRRSSMSNFAVRVDADREIYFDDVDQTYDTIVTDTMKHSRDKGYIAGTGLGFIISLAAGDRTLDFELDGKNFALLNNGLKIYVNFLKKAKESEDDFGQRDSDEKVVLVASPRSSVRAVSEESYETRESFLARMYRSNTMSSEPGLSEYDIGRPINSMHPAVYRLLIAQQRRILVDMWRLLRQGVLILKYNKSGRPKLRYLYCDLDMKKLFWRTSVKDKPNDKATNEEDSEGEREREVERRKSLREATRRKSRRSSAMSFTVRSDVDRELYFDEIEEICNEISTDVMQSSSDKGFITSSPEFLISIKTANMSLDFELDEGYFLVLNHGLKILFDFLKNIPKSDFGLADFGGVRSAPSNNSIDDISF